MRTSRRRLNEALQIGELLANSAVARKTGATKGHLAITAASTDLRVWRKAWQSERARCKASGEPKPPVFKKWMASKIASWL